MPYLFLGSLVRARLLAGRRGGRAHGAAQRDAAPGGLRDALADALEDPSLELVYWLPERQRYVDFRGRDYELPEDDPSRAVHTVARDGDCVAAIIYDATLRRPSRTSRPWAPPPRSRS